jgi:TRAP transporter TAXI family solute receptor
MKTIVTRTLAVLSLALASALATAPANAQKVELRWVSAALGSTSYNHAATTAAIINKYSSKVTITAVPSAGSVENARLLHTKRADIATSNTQIAYNAYNGKGPYKDQNAIKEMRLLWHFVVGVTHVYVNADSNIHSAADLKGHKIAIVRPGSSAYTQAVDFLKAAGLTLKDLNVQEYSQGEQVQAFKDGNVEGVITGGGLNSSPLMEATTGRKVRFIGLTDQEWERVKAATPPGYYSHFTIPANTYPNQTEPVQTFAIPTFWATTTALPDDIAYELTKTFFEHRDEAIKMLSGIKATTLESQTLSAPIPWHPGSMRYFKEKGVFK